MRQHKLLVLHATVRIEFFFFDDLILQSSGLPQEARNRLVI